MKLNPTKCAFGVTSKKFLKFIVLHRGIEVNLEKIQAEINGHSKDDGGGAMTYRVVTALS